MITGLGAVTSIGNDVPTFWRNLVAGVSGAGPLQAFDTDGFPVQIACEVTNFDPTAYIERKAARHMHRSAHFALACARQALEDAGLAIRAENATRVGVVINTGAGGFADLEDAAHTLAEKGPRSIGPFVVPTLMPNAVACQVSIGIGAKGPVLTSTLACASGSYALLEATRFIETGEADVVLAGGSEAAITPVLVTAFHRMGALASRSVDPSQACRPFDAERDGFVYGEGAAVMVLESEAHALQRGAHIYAEVLGGSLTADAYHITAPDRDGAGAAQAMQRTLSRTHLSPDAVDVIFAHGTATPLNDAMETKAIHTVFQEHASRLAVTATKSMVGHTLGAAGAISALAAVLSLNRGVVPPTINYGTPDPACDLDYVPNTARACSPRVALVNAFGFGGQNVALLLGAYEGR